MITIMIKNFKDSKAQNFIANTYIYTYAQKIYFMEIKFFNKNDLNKIFFP